MSLRARAARPLACLLIVAASAAAPTSAAADGPPGAFQDQRIDGFVVRFGDVPIVHREFAVYVLPKEKVRVALEGIEATAEATFRVTGGNLARVGDGAWEWTAPAKPGELIAQVQARAVGEPVRLNVFVMHPASKVRRGRLNGYRIGEYPRQPLRGLAQYRQPRGFVEVRPDNHTLQVSPHFTLGQFVCKQAGGWPKYLVLDERLLLRLERILAHVNAAGIRTDGFTVLSGYRTPYYNEKIGNVEYSRHQYGDAADVYVDVDPADGRMDDLDGDGRETVADAQYLAALIEELTGAATWEPGGVGIYAPKPHRGPFVHVDTRGFKARW